MTDETTTIDQEDPKTPETMTLEDFNALQIASIRETANEVDKKRAGALFDSIKSLLEKPAASRSEDAALARPAGSAARAVPADLSDWRYRQLPEWQRSVRTPDADVLAKRFFRALAANDRPVLRQIHEEGQRATLTEGNSDATGIPFDGTAGQLLPLPLSNMLLTTFYKVNRIYREARVHAAGVGASLRIPIQDAESTSNWVAEATAPGGTGEPTAGASLNLQLQKHLNLSKASSEILEDSAFNVGAWLSQDVGSQMAEAEDIAMWQTGAGLASNQPVGMETADTTVTATNGPAWYVPIASDQDSDYTAEGTLTYAHLVKMFYALPELERRGAIWAGNSMIAEFLSTLVDGQGRPILRMQNDAGGIVGDPDADAATSMILGRRFVEMPGAAGAADQGTNRLYLINMDRTYQILEKGGIRAAISTDLDFDTDQVAFRFIHRTDGQPIGNAMTTRYRYVYTGNITA